MTPGRYLFRNRLSTPLRLLKSRFVSLCFAPSVIDDDKFLLNSSGRYADVHIIRFVSADTCFQIKQNHYDTVTMTFNTTFRTHVLSVRIQVLFFQKGCVMLPDVYS